MANPDGRYGQFQRLPVTNLNAPYLPRTDLRCPPDTDPTSPSRVGGEGFAVVLQSIGLDAVGCAGSGVGYASGSQAGGVPGCTSGGIPRSVAIQFDTHHHGRTVTTSTCNDQGPDGHCRPGALKVTSSFVAERKHAISVYIDGENTADAHLLQHLLGHVEPKRLDDGQPHQVRIVYLPPARYARAVNASDNASSGAAATSPAQGRLSVYFDETGISFRETGVPTISLPITLPMPPRSGCINPNTGNATSGDGASSDAGGAATDASGCDISQMLPGAVSTESAEPPVNYEHPSTQPIPLTGDVVHRAYVGFTAATGEASEQHDIRRVSFCHRLGCSVL